MGLFSEQNQGLDLPNPGSIIGNTAGGFLGGVFGGLGNWMLILAAIVGMSYVLANQ